METTPTDTGHRHGARFLPGSCAAGGTRLPPGVLERFEEPGFIATDDSYAVRWWSATGALLVVYGDCAAERYDYLDDSAQRLPDLDAVSFAPEDRINEAVPESQR